MEVAVAESDIVRDALIRRTLEFCRMLKQARLNVTPGRIIDVFRSLTHIHLEERNEFRLTLRANLASSREEERIFDQLFAAFWEAKAPRDGEPEEIDLESRDDDRNQEVPERPPEQKGAPQQYSRDEVLRLKDLLDEWPGGWQEFERILKDLAIRLATRPSRRFKVANRGRRIDLRQSLRRNMRYGMDMVELVRAQRKIRKTRVVMLCDVSGSMDTYCPFLLQLMFGLQKALKNSRTAVFSTQVTEITRALRRHTVERTLREVSDLARHWSGGTDIGGALRRLNRRIIREGLASSTVCIIVSDGYDQGDASVVKREMEALRRRVRVVVWVNPLLGTEGYAPMAHGMRVALPHVDHFLPAHDVHSLRGLCRTLATV